MRKMVQLFLAVPLCGCVAAAPRHEAADRRVDPMPISLALEEIITAGVRPHLNDPLSARFGTMLAGERTLRGRQEIVVCGYVSDKRSSSGSEAFVAKIYPDAANSFELMAIEDGSPDMKLQVAGACREAGLPILDPDQKPHP